MKIRHRIKSKWFQFRRRLASLLVRIASKIYPESPEVMTFYAKCMLDYVIKGKYLVRVEDSEISTKTRSF